MNPQRQPKQTGGGVKPPVVHRNSCARVSSVRDDASPPPKHKKENGDDEERIESVNFSDRGIKPKRMRECDQQPRAKRRRENQNAVDAGMPRFFPLLRTFFLPPREIRRRQHQLHNDESEHGGSERSEKSRGKIDSHRNISER